MPEFYRCGLAGGSAGIWHWEKSLALQLAQVEWNSSPRICVPQALPF